jgi:spore maturation protein CgeB
MNLLIIGSSLPSSIENSMLPGFLDAQEVESVMFIENNELFSNLSWLARVDRRLFPNRNRAFRRFNRMVNVRLQQENSPDVVLVFKGMEVFPETLQALRKSAKMLVNYNPDSPVVFSGRGSGNGNVREGLEYYDLYLTYAGDIREAIRLRGVESEVVPFGFENQPWMSEELTELEETVATCFVGNPDAHRVDFLKKISIQLPLHLYGSGWEMCGFPDTVRIFPAVTGERFYRTLRAYRVQWNLMRPHNWDSHNMRTFDVPGCGGIGLMPWTSDHIAFFNQRKEVLLYRNLPEAIDLAGELLKLDFSEAQEIRRAARLKALSLKSDYKDRAREIITVIKASF